MTRRPLRTTTSFALAIMMLLAACGSDGSSVSTSSETGPPNDAARHASADTAVDARCPFLRAAITIPKGTTAAHAVAEGMVIESMAPVGALPPTVIPGFDQLDGTAAFDIGPDTVLVEGMFEPPDPSLEASGSPRPAPTPVPSECDQADAPS